MRFELRTVFLVVLVSGVICVLVRHVEDAVARRRKALQALYAKDAVLTEDLGFPTEFKVEFEGAVSREDLENVNDVGTVTVLFLTETRLTDEVFRNLRPTSRIRTLFLDRNDLTDDCIEHMCTFRALEHVDIQNTRISRAGVRRLNESLPGCRVIR